MCRAVPALKEFTIWFICQDTDLQLEIFTTYQQMPTRAQERSWTQQQIVSSLFLKTFINSSQTW